MTEYFEFAGGTVVGRSHRAAGKNNQDAYRWLQTPGCSVAAVCDGCSSARHSEVGAGIGAELIVQSIMRYAGSHLNDSPAQLEDTASNSLWEKVRRDVLRSLSRLAKRMGEPESRAITDYFLFTVVGALIMPLSTAVFAIGDGVAVVNGELIPIGPFPDNAPPYLAYGLLRSSLVTHNPEMLRFKIHRTLPTAELGSFLIGTDGVQDLVNVSARNIPGKSEAVGPVCRFWQQEQYFANPDMIRRRLAGVNRDVTSLNSDRNGLQREAGLLPDDTTMIVGRRRPTASDKREAQGRDAL